MSLLFNNHPSRIVRGLVDIYTEAFNGYYSLSEFPHDTKPEA